MGKSNLSSIVEQEYLTGRQLLTTCLSLFFVFKLFLLLLSRPLTWNGCFLVSPPPFPLKPFVRGSCSIQCG